MLGYTKNENVDLPTIHHAAQAGDISNVARFLREGVDVEDQNETKNTPLHIAALYGHLDIVVFLSLKNANFNAVNELNYTPLHYAACWGHTKIVKFLVSKGVKVDALSNKSRTPLHLSVFGGNTETIEFLLEAGANLEAQDETNETPLGIAVAQNQFEIMSLLILKGRNEPPSFEIVGEKVVLEFADEKVCENFLPYLKLLIRSPIKNQRNIISLPMYKLNKMVLSDVEKNVFEIGKILQSHNEIFGLFPISFEGYSLSSVTQDGCVVYSYKTKGPRLDYLVQKFNHAARSLDVSAFCNKSLFCLKFPRGIFISEKFLELRSAIMSIVWQASAEISITPVTTTSFRQTMGDEAERAAELKRREDEREIQNERKKELALQELFFESRLKTQCETDSLSEWSEMEEALPNPLVNLDVPRPKIDYKTGEPDERKGGIELIRDPIDDKGKEEEAPSEKKKEKKKPKRQKMSLVELEQFVSPSSSSSLIVMDAPNVYTQGFQQYRGRGQNMNQPNFKRANQNQMRK
jgi:hypothetical protein